MATQAVKVKNEGESTGSAITGAASGIGERVKETVANSREFLHDVRVEAKQVTWPTREDVVATTGVVIATVFFFGVFLWVVDLGVSKSISYILKIFGA